MKAHQWFRRIRVPGGAAFFAAYALYVWLRLDPRLLYDAGIWFPPFQTGTAFLWRHLPLPGGASEYVAAALSQTYALGWAGALCITGVAWILFALAGRLGAIAGVPGARWLRYVPPLLVLCIYTQHGYHLAALCALSIAVAGAVMLLRLPFQRAASYALGCTAVAVAIYLVAGGALHVYALLGAVAALRERSGWRRALACLAVAGVIPWVIGIAALDLTPRDAYWRVTPWAQPTDPDGRVALELLYFCFPVFMAASLWPAAAVLRRAGESAVRQVRPALLRALALAGILAAALLPFHADRHRVWRIDYFTRVGDWERVLAEARRLPMEDYTLDVSHNILQALYHTGKLPDELFAYAQRPESVAICLPECTGVGSRLSSVRALLFFDIGDHALQIGLVNEAAHEAHEALESCGERPTTLRRLALVYLAKRQTETARVFLRALLRDPVHSGWAREMLARLDADPHLDGDANMRRIRACMMTEDPPFRLSSFAVACQALLARNPRNRMAYEYLMADYLVRRQLGAFVSDVRRLKDFGYARIPRHFEEAIVLYELHTGARVRVPGYEVSPAARERLEALSRSIAGLDDEQAAQAAAPEFGNTYYYYFLFGQSGVGDQ